VISTYFPLSISSKPDSSRPVIENVKFVVPFLSSPVSPSTQDTYTAVPITINMIKNSINALKFEFFVKYF
jgi:hypothetical protein